MTCFLGYAAQIIVTILKTTMAAKDISSGMMLISNEHLMVLFHLDDADNISFAQSNITTAKTAKTPYSGSSIAVVIDVIAPFVLTDANALTNAVDAKDVNILPFHILYLYIYLFYYPEH